MNLPNIEAKRSEAAKFLESFRQAAAGQRPKVIDRQKNQRTLIDLGLTLNEQAKIILSLTPDNYVSGPDRDRDRPGFVWVFGAVIYNTEVYIKLKIAEYTPKGNSAPVREALCISFHPAKDPMNYPLK